MLLRLSCVVSHVLTSVLREIHHTFGNLDQRNDPNPFVSEYKDKDKPHPSHGWENLKSHGWERNDII